MTEDERRCLQHAAFLAGAEYMPPLPTEGPLTASQDLLKSSYLWAGLAASTLGADATFMALSGVMNAINARNWPEFRGWRNVGDALADWGRLAGIEDQVH
jgi:hypothetical protein